MHTHLRPSAALTAIIFALVSSGTRAAENASPAVEVPRILILDAAPIWARYIAPGAEPHDAQKRRIALTEEMQPVLRRFAAKAGAGIVLNKLALLAAAQSAEIDPHAVMLDLDKTDAPANPSEPLPPARDGEPVAVSPTLLVANRDFISKTLQNEGVTDVDGRLVPVLPQIRADTRVSLLMNRSAVVFGVKGADVTMMVLDRTHGREDQPVRKEALLPMHFLTIDRERLLRESKVGNSIVAQVQVLIAQATDEFKPRGDALKAQGEALQAKLESLQPEEQKKEVDAFKLLEQALQSDVAARQKKIMDAVLITRSKIEQALNPIASVLLAKHGAEFLLDSSAVLLAPDGSDITPDCLARLDAEMPSVKLELAP